MKQPLEKNTFNASLAAEFEIEYPSVRLPHQKTVLTTRFGRLVERTSYAGIFLLALLTLVASTCYFYTAAYSKSGIVYSSDSKFDLLLDALYFSVVTFTSLGYGDISPNGFGKLVACCIAILGLILVALFVGKVASERQVSLLLLLHTSDSQRRLMAFCNDIDAAQHAIVAACIHPGGSGLSVSVNHMASRLNRISKYVVFQSHQAELATFGNDSALKALYVHLEAAQSACAHAFRSEFANEDVGNRSLKLIIQIAEIVMLLVMFQKNAKRHWLRRAVQIDDAPPVRGMLRCVHDLMEWACNNESTWLILKVKQRYSSLAWTGSCDQQINAVATSLQIPELLAQRCIDIWPNRLRGPGRIRRPRLQTREQMLKEKFIQLCDFSGEKLTQIDKAAASGAQIGYALEHLRKRIAKTHNDLITHGWQSELRKLSSHDIQALFAESLRISEAMTTIERSSVFNGGEKKSAGNVNDHVARLVCLVFESCYGVNPIWFTCFPAWLATNTPTAIGQAAIAKRVRRSVRNMTLSELFAPPPHR